MKITEVNIELTADETTQITTGEVDAKKANRARIWAEARAMAQPIADLAEGPIEVVVRYCNSCSSANSWIQKPSATAGEAT